MYTCTHTHTVQNTCKLSPKEVVTSFGVNLHLLSPLQRLEANLSPMIKLNISTCYCRSYSLEPIIGHSIALKTIEGYTKLSGGSAATKFGAKLHLFFTVCASSEPTSFESRRFKA